MRKKTKTLPEFVGLGSWIESRMGTEVELQKLESGHYVIDWPGTLSNSKPLKIGIKVCHLKFDNKSLKTPAGTLTIRPLKR